MADAIQWYLGQCTRRDQLAHVIVRGMLNDGKWTSIPNVKQLLGKTDEVEVRFSDQKPIKTGDWVSFQLAPRRRGETWKASRYKRYAHFHSGIRFDAPDQAQRLLTVEGISDGSPSGMWAFRMGDQVLLIELGQHASKLLASPSAKVFSARWQASEVEEFDPGSGNLPLFRIPEHEKELTRLDWSTDEQFLSRMIKSMSMIGDKRFAVTHGAFERYAKEVLLVRDVNPADISAATDSVRTGKILRIIETNITALTELRGLLDGEGRIRAALESAAQAEVEAAIAAYKSTRIEKVERDLKVRESEMLATIRLDLDLERVAMMQALSEEIASTKKEELRRIELELVSAKDKARDELATLVTQCSTEIDRLASERQLAEGSLSDAQRALAQAQATLDGLNESIERLAEKEKLAVDRLLTIDGRAEQGRPIVSGGSGISIFPSMLRRANVPVLALDGLQDVLETLDVLTEVGRQQCVDLLALLAAKEVPLLYGQDVVPLMSVLEDTFFVGHCERLVADPTIMTFDDLWVRPGAHVGTQLARCLELANTDGQSSSLGIIEGGERSAIKYWYPALSRAMRTGGFGDRMLMCCTLYTDDLEMSAEWSDTPIMLKISGALASDAGAAVVQSADVFQGRRLFLDLAKLDLAKGIRAVSGVAKTLSPQLAARAVNACAVAYAISGNAGAKRMAARFAEAAKLANGGA